ncbi:amidohydrolase family protein [Leucobacter allii]|uniref:amidohydrolase family protein n=1 Tax=Leucobacter allii TaxID=2932247 RepID=UPI001FD4DDE2|nr:amidohydrolase family protein [Leucobacter allii]UOR00990.1 amidohydrolase family protein [Leucobacter allii]
MPAAESTMPTAARGVRILDDVGGFAPPGRVSWAGGRFALGEGSARADPEPELDGSGLWMIPGLVDAHLHAGWHAFDAAERARLGAERTRRATADGLARTLASGVTSIRDAGGLDAGLLAGIPSARRPRTQRSERPLGPAEAEAAGGLRPAVEAVLATGAPWVKIIATRGVAAPPELALEPIFARAELADAVRRAAVAGARVMVHAWGGRAIDDAIAAGAASLEHGIFLTDAQAASAAEAGLVLVPTLRIYRLVQRMIAAGALPAAFRARVDEAVAAHPRAVRRARDAGLPIALGTDYGTPEQHGTGRLEFDALVDAGLTPEEALIAATRTGARMLAGAGARSGAPRADELAGRIADGADADAVILRRDPREPGALSAPDAVAAVLLDGRLLDPAELADPAEPTPESAPERTLP